MCNNKSISKQKQSKLCSYPVSLSDVLSNRVFLLWPYAQCTYGLGVEGPGLGLSNFGTDCITDYFYSSMKTQRSSDSTA